MRVLIPFIGLLAFAGWVTHLVVSIQAQEWLFMIVGALLGPVAIIHGWATWFGYNWF